METALGKLNKEKEEDAFYVYTVVKEDWKTGEQGKRTKEYYSNQPKLKIGGLYMHLGRGFPGCYRVLSVKEEHDLIRDTGQKKGEMMNPNSLKVGDKIKVHLYDANKNEIKTNVYDKVFVVYEKDGKLGIDWKDNKFASFDTFASSVNFENIETGQTYHYDTISGKVEKTGDVVNRGSVIKKLSDNKKILDAKAAEQRDVLGQEKVEKYHENPER